MQDTFVYKGNDQVIPLSVEMIRIDPTVDVIEKYTFEDYDKLRFVHFCEGLREIGSSAFSNCISLESIRLPSAMRVIHKGAFYNCENLKYVILNEGLECIEKDAFSGCGMELLWMPSTVKYVRTGSFDNCQALRRVALNEGLVKVENYAFNRCDKLESIEIPSSSDYSSTIQVFAVPENAAIVAIKDLESWNDVLRKHEQEYVARMEKYGMVVEQFAKMTMNQNSKSPPQDEKRPTKTLQNSLKAPVASAKNKQESREVLLQKLADKRQHIEWLQTLLASAQKERDEMQAKLTEWDMPE